MLTWVERRDLERNLGEFRRMRTVYGDGLGIGYLVLRYEDLLIVGYPGQIVERRRWPWVEEACRIPKGSLNEHVDRENIKRRIPLRI